VGLAIFARQLVEAHGRRMCFESHLAGEQDLYQAAVGTLRATLQEAESLQPASEEEGLKAWQGQGLCLEYSYPFPWPAFTEVESSPLNVAAFLLLREGETAWLLTVEGDYYKINLRESRLDPLKRFSEAQGLMAYRKADQRIYLRA
jgi:hypothetical protein